MYIAPNFKARFGDLPPERARELYKFSIAGKDKLLKELAPKVEKPPEPFNVETLGDRKPREVVY